MIITLSPIRSDDTLTLERTDTALVLNGVTVDLATYDAEVAPHASIIGQPQLVEGVWHVTVLMPYGPPPADVTPEALEAVTYPQPVEVAEDGAVPLPVMPVGEAIDGEVA